MSEQPTSVQEEQTGDSPKERAAAGSSDSSDSEGGWVVITECGQEAEASANLKKRVWQARIIQRRPVNKVAEAENLDERTVEAYTAEVEAIRHELGLHYTWFEEEMEAGKYDAVLRRRQSDKNSNPSKLLAPPSYSAVPVSVLNQAEKGKKGRPKLSPASSAKSTPKLKPQIAPSSPPIHLVPTQEVPEPITMPPPEVWLAAKEHRKTNFFGNAFFGEGKPGGILLQALLRNVEVSSALSLAMASQPFARALLANGDAEFWDSLGYSCRRRCHDGGDPRFRHCARARHRAFFKRVAGGKARPAALTPVLDELAFPEVQLGPFLSQGKRLLVCDGRQSFHVVDVEKRKVEEVQVDRFHTREIRSSLGAHPTSVTASRPLQGHGVVGRGVLAAMQVPQRGVNAKEALSAFQWLELPDFEASAGNSTSPPGAPKPKASGKQVPQVKVEHAGSTGDLLRASVSQDRVAAALGSTSPCSFEVERVWPLQEGRALLLVHETPAAAGKLKPPCSPGLGPRSPGLGPSRSPGLGPARSPGIGPSASPNGPSPRLAAKSSPTSPATSASSAPIASPQVTFAPPARRADGGLAAFELPGSACQAKTTEGSTWWLQVWDIPEVAGHRQRPEADLVAAVPLGEKVTDASFLAGAEGGLLLCGFQSGGAELRPLPPGDFATQRCSWPAAEASGGEARRVLLLHHGGASETTLAVVAQAGSVVLHSSTAGKDVTHRLLPAEAFESAIHVFDVRYLSSCRFALCTDAFVYAFEVPSPAAGPQLRAAVKLPVQNDVAIPTVLSFATTPYEFLVVLGEEAVSSTHNAFCCLWPEDEETDQQGGGKASPPGAKTEADSVQLQAWVNRGNEKMSELKVSAVVLNKLFAKKHDELWAGQEPLISSVHVHWPKEQPGDASWGRGLLAVSAVGTGVAVFRWGVEASPELEHFRHLRRQQAAEEAEQREKESMRRQLRRLSQRLKEMEKLEERLQAGGAEALTEEEHAKLERRPQVERDVERLTHELGLDEAEVGDCGEDSESEKERCAQEAARQKRREKERQQKEHQVNKRSLQKERQKNRDIKGQMF